MIRLPSRFSALAPALAVLLVMLAAALVRPVPASANAKLDTAIPAMNGRVDRAPTRLDLFFTEPLSSAAVRLFDDAGREVILDAAMSGSGGPNHVTVSLPAGLGNGTWTVGWTVRSAMDNAATSGLYAFHVGPGPLPGSAQIDSAWPKPWAVAARWLAFLGLAVAGGALLLSRLAAPSLVAPRGERGSPAWFGAGALGATLALLMLALVPVLASLFPAASADPPSLAGSFASMPTGFLACLFATLLAALLMLGILASGRGGSLPAWVDWAGLVLVLAALDGFGRFAHPGATLASAIVETLHQWPSALLVGGGLLLVLAWVRGDEAASAPARFAPLGLLLALIALLTGLAGAWLELSRPGDVLALRWGWALIVKLVLLLPMAAGILLLWRSRSRLGDAPPMLLRLGAMVAVLGLAAAAAMPLMARPGVQTYTSLAELDLPAAFPMPDGSRGMAHLILQPGQPGQSAIFARLQRKDGSVLPPSEAPMLELTIEPLDRAGEPHTVTLEPDPNGGYAFGAANLSGDGWNHARLTIVPPQGDPTAVSFWFILPDPNMTGLGPLPPDDPAARSLFTRALDTLRTLRSTRYTQRLSDGNGSLYQSINEATDAMDGQPAAFRELILDSDTEQVIVGDTQWTRTGSQPWEERASASLYLPSQWWEVYQPGTGFQLGPEEEIDGERCQVVTFHLPRSLRTAPAWYAWWVGEETGRIRRETMVSQRHYMVYTFGDFNEPLGITPPAERAGPPGPSSSGNAAATPTP